AVLPAMLSADRGEIVNISSIYGHWGTATSASYSVSKFALAGYTESLQQSLVGSGVHVMGVFPGYIKTDMTTPFVKTGSMRSYIGKSADDMARAILRAVKNRKRDLYFPWYVPLALKMHRCVPKLADRMAMRAKR